MTIAMQPIYTQTVGSGGASTLSFNNIPQTFTDLKVVVSARQANSGTALEVYVDYNLNSASIYGTTWLTGTGSGVASGRLASAGGVVQTFTTGSTATANTFGSFELYLPNYTSSNTKQSIIDAVTENNGTTVEMKLTATSFASSSPITVIRFSPAGGSFVQHSTFSLYGITKG